MCAFTVFVHMGRALWTSLVELWTYYYQHGTYLLGIFWLGVRLGSFARLVCYPIGIVNGDT